MTFIPKKLPRLFGSKTSIANETLKKWNMALALLFAAQGVAVLVFGAVRTVPVNVLYLTTDTLQGKLTHGAVMAPALHQLFMLNIAYLIALMLFVAALMYGYVATWGRTRYEAGLKKGMNTVRWAEFGIGSAAILLTVGLLAGVYDAASLLALVSLAAVTGVLGVAMDTTRGSAKRRNEPYHWLVPAAALISGLVSWLIIGVYLCMAHTYGGGNLPAAAYGIFAWGLLGFLAIAANTHLVDTKNGRWAQYVYGESWYMGVNLVMKSVFAWIVFAAVLHP